MTMPAKLKTRRSGKFSLEKQVFRQLECWRQYRTYFHIRQFILGNIPKRQEKKARVKISIYGRPRYGQNPQMRLKGIGKEHDFRTFKKSKARFREDIECLVIKDIKEFIKSTLRVRYKKKQPRGGELNREQKKAITSELESELWESISIENSSSLKFCLSPIAIGVKEGV